MSKKPTQPPKLKVRVPFAFEAEGEGLIPILCVASLGLLVVILVFVVIK
jgi:hypothetical protein